MIYVCVAFVLMGNVAFSAEAYHFDTLPKGPPPPYEFCMFRGQDAQTSVYIGEDEAVVRFKSKRDVLYEVSWDTYGLMYNNGSSVKAVLERNLLAGNMQGFFSTLGAEMTCMMKDVFSVCVRKRLCVHYSAGDILRLEADQLDSMFPRREHKQWRTLRAGDGYERDLMPGEFRILFSTGGYSCVAAREVGPDGYEYGTERYRQILHESTGVFVRKVQRMAQQALMDLQRASAFQGEKVAVRHVCSDGLVRGVVWDVRDVKDCYGVSVCTFLHDSVMQGTSLGYTDENSVKYYPFINDDIRKMLQRNLVSCLKKKQHLTELPLASVLREKDVKAMRYLSWTVLPEGILKCRHVPNTWSLTLSGVTLEGVPLPNEKCLTSLGARFSAYILPRSYLWALDYDELCKEKSIQRCASWYGAYIRSRRMDWGG